MTPKWVSRIISCIVAVIVFFVTLFPVYWLILTSFKDSTEIFKMPPTFIPRLFTLAHYAKIFSQYNVGRYFLNSVFITAVSTAAILLIASMAAYSISRFEFKGKRLFYVGILITQMLPIVTLMIPLYSLWSNAKLLDNYFPIIVTYIGFYTSVGIWLLTAYIEGIPKSIDESAAIDGCPSFLILFKIILPLSKPGLMAVGITIILMVWQELFVSLTFITNDSLRTLPSAIMGFIGSPNGVDWGSLTAMGVMSFVPVFIVYLFLQKYLVKGMTAGSVKE